MYFTLLVCTCNWLMDANSQHPSYMLHNNIKKLVMTYLVLRQSSTKYRLCTIFAKPNQEIRSYQTSVHIKSIHRNHIRYSFTVQKLRRMKMPEIFYRSKLAKEPLDDIPCTSTFDTCIPFPTPQFSWLEAPLLAQPTCVKRPGLCTGIMVVLLNKMLQMLGLFFFLHSLISTLHSLF